MAFNNRREFIESLTPGEVIWVQSGTAGILLLQETTAPSATAGVGKLYAKSADGNLYFKTGAGTEYQLTPVGAGSGTVTSVSVVSANGLAGTVATATTTPAITLTTTITGILSGNGTAISAASTTGSGAVVLANTPTLITPVIGVATGTSLTLTGAIRSNTSLILEETGAGTDIITIQAPASIAASYTLTLPIDDGTPSQVLTTDGSGVTSWTTPSSGGVNALTYMGL